MAEVLKKMTRKEKIAAGVEKKPKRKKASAEARKTKRQETAGAQLRNMPTSNRKMRMIIDMIRGMQVETALNLLKLTTRAGAAEVRKLLISAISNWESKNNGARVEDSGLIIKTAYVNEGRTIKRFRPAPQGRAYRIRKRSNHVTLILATKENDK